MKPGKADGRSVPNLEGEDPGGPGGVNLYWATEDLDPIVKQENPGRPVRSYPLTVFVLTSRGQWIQRGPVNHRPICPLSAVASRQFRG